MKHTFFLKYNTGAFTLPKRASNSEKMQGEDTPLAMVIETSSEEGLDMAYSKVNRVKDSTNATFLGLSKNEGEDMKKTVLALCLGLCSLCSSLSMAADPPLSDATSECLDCHSMIHPGIVKDWQNSRHSKITPKQAMEVKGSARKVSATAISEDLLTVSVGCAECHGLRPKDHEDTVEHNGHDIHVVVSPNDCATCHPLEAVQYSKNLMAQAHGNLATNPLYRQLEQSIIGKIKIKGGKVVLSPADDQTKAEACYHCHGTQLKVIGFETRDTELAGELKLPVIQGWPNQGVGRINPDGSKGSCAACHARHEFAIETARKPYTCKQCHVGPDVPAFKVYSASKHGNIFSSRHKSWNFDDVPWTIGEDFTAPTCAACHISLLVKPDGDVVVERTHQMGDRLPWRIFGLIYAHPHPQDADITIIRNKDDQPIPTDLNGGMATKGLINRDQQVKRQKTMQAVCLNCHDASWVNGYWQRFENTIEQTNAKTLEATRIMVDIWKNGFAKGLSHNANPFDEAIEKKWTDIWQFYANATRFASAMGGGGDYGVYAGGQYQLTQAVMELNDWLVLHKRLSEVEAKNPQQDMTQE